MRYTTAVLFAYARSEISSTEIPLRERSYGDHVCDHVTATGDPCLVTCGVRAVTADGGRRAHWLPRDRLAERMGI
jgi:hypothetical protein